MESQEVQDFRGCRAKEAYRDLQVQREMLVLRERKDLKALQELMVQGGFLVLLDLLVQVDQTERRVKPAHRDQQDAEDQEE